MRSDCVNLRGENKRHCRLEIDRQRGIGAGIAVRSTRAEHDHGGRQRQCHNVSQENGWELHAQGRNHSSRSAVRHNFQGGADRLFTQHRIEGGGFALHDEHIVIIHAKMIAGDESATSDTPEAVGVNCDHQSIA
jgi:hypothetical protein